MGRHHKHKHSRSSSSSSSSHHHHHPVPGPVGPTGPAGPSCGTCENDCNNYCKQVYANEIQPILQVGVVGPYPPYSQLDEQTNTWSGWDIELLTRVAARLPCVQSIQITNYNSVTDALLAVRNGDADLITDSSITVNGERLADVSFICIEGTVSKLVALIYGVTGTVATIVNGLGPDPSPDSIIPALIANGEPILLVPGSGTIQDNTLLSAGYENTSIVADKEATSSSSAAILQAFLDNPTALAFLSDSTVDTQEQIDYLTSNLPPNYTFVAVSLGQAQQGRGTGWAVNQMRCKFISQAEHAFDQLLVNGGYEEAQQATIDSGVEGATPEFFATLVKPDLCCSVKRGFVAKACLDGCCKCPVGCDEVHDVVILGSTPRA